MKNLLTKIKNFIVDPAFVHSLIAFAFQALVGVPLLFVDLQVAAVAIVVAGAFAFGFYVGRERHQAERGAGSKFIAPWNFSGNPDGPRQFIWPGIATSVVSMGVASWAFW